MMSSRVSILMSVYNGEKYLKQAVDSILGQTFGDFEFIVVDDASTDGTAAVLDSYADVRIVRVKNAERTGLANSLNKGLSIAQGEYIARQDADDFSLPNRLEHEVKFLDEHPDIGLVGTACFQFSDSGMGEGLCKMPTDDQEIQYELLMRNCFIHGSVMARRSILHQVSGYNGEFLAAQDYDLWLRLAEVTRLANLPEPLYRWRRGNGLKTRRFRWEKYSLRAVEAALERREVAPSDLAPEQRESLARRYLTWAVACYIAGSINLALDYVSRAVLAWSGLRGNIDWLIAPKGFVNYAWTVIPSWGEEFVQAIKFVGKHLLASGVITSGQARRMIGRADLVVAIQSAKQGATLSATVHTIHAVRYAPCSVWNYLMQHILRESEG